MYVNPTRRETREGQLSRSMYLGLMTVFVACGIAFSGMFAMITKDLKVQQLGLPAIIGVLALGIIGIFINKGSTNPAISTIGFALVAGPFGLLLGPILASKTDASTVWRAFFVASAAVIVFGAIGTFIKTDLGFLSSIVIGALSAAIVGYLGIYALGALGMNIGGALSLLDWAVVALFLGITAYDLNQALRDDWTLDNAVDNALSVYLDWFNIFIRLLKK